MNDFANGFLKGYKAAVEDATPGFFANMDSYDGFNTSGIFTYFLENIKLEDINEEGKPYEASMKEYIETCLEDWLISHYAEIKRDFEEEEWFEEEHESEEDFGDCKDCVHACPKDNGDYFCTFHNMNMHKDNTCGNFEKR